jgi:NADPH-dependent glutamate synthase beta subunit-like oxidoreductase/NAD-dependent dihydropyrimidine dehydrogenase PreA subunit/bacterioferritin-associated ferredoxin
MKKITTRADLDPTKCVGCSTCTHVCPVGAMRPNHDRPFERTKIPPCSDNCPAGNDVEGFIRLMLEKKTEEALLLLQKTNPFPAITGRVCFHPCEDACNRKEFDSSVSIPYLERYVSEYETKARPMPSLPNRKERIAIIGSGPAGLTCSYYLLKKGYAITLFESKPLLGGWLRYGIPEYRLPKKTLDQEISKLLNLGLNVKTNITVGKDFSLEELETFDAVFIASGRHRDTKLNVPGENLKGVFSGGEFLKKFHAGERQPLGKRVAVIGGGNTAVDAARVALRLGSKPTVIYRRSRNEMPAFKKEVEEMEKEGIELVFLASPIRFIPDNGRIKSLECIRTELKEIEPDGRKRAIPIPNSTFTFETDSVIVAIGQEPDFSYLFSDLTTEKEKIKTDLFGRTDKGKIFAGGDVTFEKGTVPSAIRSGRIAAEAIDDYLNSRKSVESIRLESVKFDQMNPDYFEIQDQRAPRRLTLADSVKGFDEIFLGYDDKMAMGEASKCFGCASLPAFVPDDCRGCGNCEQRCPTLAIKMKPLETPFTVRVEVSQSDPKMIAELCQKAHLHPKSIVCFCTTTRAEEIGAAILQGAKTPEEISLRTGARTGCSVLCIQPIFRLLEAAKAEYLRPIFPDIWYKSISEIWDIPKKVKDKYDKVGFRFEEDIEFYKKLTRS